LKKSSRSGPKGQWDTYLRKPRHLTRTVIGVASGRRGIERDGGDELCERGEIRRVRRLVLAAAIVRAAESALDAQIAFRCVCVPFLTARRPAFEPKRGRHLLRVRGCFAEPCEPTSWGSIVPSVRTDRNHGCPLSKAASLRRSRARRSLSVSSR
jgi:hypothetical protein